MPSSIEAFLGSSFTALGAAILLQWMGPRVIGTRAALWSAVVLFGWAIYRTPFVQRQPSGPKILVPLLFASGIGLALFVYDGWRPFGAQSEASAVTAPILRTKGGPLPLGANYIRPRLLELVHELEIVSGKEFRMEAAGMLMPGEKITADSSAQTLFALSPNAGFSIAPSLRPVTDAMAAVDAFMLRPTDIGSHTEKDGSHVSGLRVFPGYEAVYTEYQNLLSMPWVVNTHKYKDGTDLSGGKQFHILLFGLRPVSERMLTRLVTVLDEAEAELTNAVPMPAAGAPTSSPDVPELVVRPPLKGPVFGVEWVPKRGFGVQTWSLGSEGKRSSDHRPVFRLKNNGLVGVTNISLVWRVEGEPLADIVRASEILKAFQPSFEDGFLMLHAPNDQHQSSPNGQVQSFGFPIRQPVEGDKIKFSPPTPTSDETADITMPGEIINDLVVRMIASPRPKFEPFIYPPVVIVDVKYWVGRQSYERSFEIKSQFIYFADGIGGAGFTTQIPDPFASPNNFRGNFVAFEVEPRH